MIPDLSQMDEADCLDCRMPVVFTQVEGQANHVRLDGCRWGREQYNLPDGILAGFEGGPFFLCTPRQA